MKVIARAIKNPQTTKLPALKDIENIFEIILENISEDDKTNEVQEGLFQVLAVYMEKWAGKVETFDQKLFAILNRLSLKYCDNLYLIVYLGKAVKICSNCKEGLELQKECFRFLFSIFDYIEPSEFMQVIPGVASLAIKGISGDISKKSEYLRNSLQLFSIIISKYFEINSREIQEFSFIVEKQEQNKMIDMIVSLDKELYGQVMESRIDADLQYIKTHNRLFETIFHFLNLFSKNTRRFSDLNKNDQIGYLKMLKNLADECTRLGISFMLNEISKLSIQIYSNVVETQDPSLNIQTEDLEALVHIEASAVESQIQGISSSIRKYHGIVQGTEKLAFLRNQIFLVKHADRIDISIEDIFKLWMFRFGGFAAGLFADKTNDLFADEAGLGNLINATKLRVDSKRVDKLILKLIRDFCSNANFKIEIIREMMTFNNEMVRRSSVIDEIIGYAEDLIAYFDRLYFQKDLYKVESVSQFENRVKKYQSIEELIDHSIHLVFVLYSISCDSKINQIEHQRLKDLYRCLNRLFTFQFILPAFYPDHEAYRIRLVLVVFESLRVTASANIFSCLLNIDNTDFRNIYNFEKHAYDLLCSDSQIEKLLHISFLNAFSRYIDSLQQLDNPNTNKQKSYIEVLGVIGDNIFERISMFQMNCSDEHLQFRNLLALSSLTNLVAQIEEPCDSSYHLGWRTINLLDSTYDDLLQNGQHFNNEILNIFESCMRIFLLCKDTFKQQAEDDSKHQKRGISNSIRILQLKISNYLEYRNSFKVNAYFGMLLISVSTLVDIPMTPETDPGDYSAEDGHNVAIPSMIGPLIHELWPRVVEVVRACFGRVLVTDILGQLVASIAIAESSTRRAHLKKQLQDLKASTYPNLDIDLFVNCSLSLKPKIVDLVNFPPSSYAEYVGVNLSNFFVKLKEIVPSFMKIEGKWDGPISDLATIYLLGNDLVTVNSVKIARNLVSSFCNEDSRVASNVNTLRSLILSKERTVEERKEVFASEFEMLKSEIGVVPIEDVIE